MGKVVQEAGRPGDGSCEVDNYATTVAVTELRETEGAGRRPRAGMRDGPRRRRSEPGLRLGDVDLDALGALGGRVLAD